MDLIINVIIIGQKLVISNGLEQLHLYESNNYDRIIIKTNFSHEWDKLSKIIAFSQDCLNYIYRDASAQEIVIPYKLQSPGIAIHFIGLEDNYVLTTNFIKIVV